MFDRELFKNDKQALLAFVESKIDEMTAELKSLDDYCSREKGGMALIREAKLLRKFKLELKKRLCNWGAFKDRLQNRIQEGRTIYPPIPSLGITPGYIMDHCPNFNYRIKNGAYRARCYDFGSDALDIDFRFGYGNVYFWETISNADLNNWYRSKRKNE